MRPSTRIRLERAVRLQILGLKSREIATEVGLSLKGLAALRSRAEYKSLSDELMKKLCARWDAALIASRVEPMLNPDCSPEEIRLRAAHIIKHPFDDL